MATITLTKEQSATLATNADEPVRICDGEGHVIAVIPPKITPEELAELQRRLAEAQAHPETLSSSADLRAMFSFLGKCEESLGRRMSDAELVQHFDNWRQRR